MAQDADDGIVRSGDPVSPDLFSRGYVDSSGGLDRTKWSAPAECKVVTGRYIETAQIIRWPSKKEDKIYSPLEDYPNLFLEFARLPYKELSEEVLEDWVEEYGFLWDAGAEKEPAKTFLTEGELAAAILTAYEAILARDGKKAIDVLLGSPYDTDDEGQIIERHRGYDEEEISEEVALSLALSEVARYVNQKLKYCHPGLDWRDIDQHAKDHSNLKRCWRFDNLLGAMYLQMWWLMVSGDDLVHCQNCGRIISLASPMEGERKRRNDKTFCNDACRQQHRYYTKIRPARLKKDLRKDQVSG